MRQQHLIAVAAAFALFFTLPAHAQKLFTRDGVVSFDATAPDSPETIKAIAKSGTCVLDKSSGAIEMAVLIKGFIFERALMQEHFNENYLESSKYPKAVFSGKLDDPASVDLGKDGTYNAKVNGKLTMHGVTKPLNAPVAFMVKGGKVSASTKFSVALSDFNISIPSLVSDKVNKMASVNIAANLAPIK
ncbi:MAG: YceI family protein [Saprospiraceae bacterium]|nr:YceI family protein [Saprospiraceae bacterium]